MKKKVFLRTAAFLLAAILLLPSILCSCGVEKIGDATLLSFKSSTSYDYLKTLDGQKVAIKGWIATASPIDGSFIFLMNMPYQSCPFCKPNTSQLSNTIEAYPKDGQSFSFTAELVLVVGTLEVAAPGSFFTDEYDYKFNFKIVDASYSLVDESEMPEDLVFWQKVAQSGILSDLDRMFNYLYFVCGEWCTRTANFQSKDGTHFTDYLHPTVLDAWLFEESSENYSYGLKDGYFNSIVSEVIKIDKEKLSNIVTIILKAEELAKKAISEIKDKKYSQVSEYSKYYDSETKTNKLIFGDGRMQYKMNNTSLGTTCRALYSEFYSWLSGWEI